MAEGCGLVWICWVLVPDSDRLFALIFFGVTAEEEHDFTSYENSVVCFFDTAEN